jgi:5,10-methenyltetrahydrofolate synthetase
VNGWREIAAWRKRMRGELIDARLAIPDAQRREHTATIARLLEAMLAPWCRGTIAFCWPCRGEVDVRFALRRLRELGATAALPVVTGKGLPLQFRQWQPGVAMVAGALGIPAPCDTAVVVPDAALVPLVGFDDRGYRLGYGGGYFDRTLAALARKPLTVGVGFECARRPTIDPQAHDIAMDFIVTEAGIRQVEDGELRHLDAAAAAARARELAARRGA